MTTDHEAAVARLKAAVETHSELKKDGLIDDSSRGCPDSGRPSVVLASAALTHEAWHGYKVCDSTRYPVFPTGRIGGPNSGSGVVSIFTTEPDVKMTGVESDTNNDVDNGADFGTCSEKQSTSSSTTGKAVEIAVLDDPKMTWTAEEDLRLLDAIRTHGLGNWIDISEAINGNGSSGKTPKRCMERYFDDFLGRYGHILPKFTVVEESELYRADFSGTESNDDNESIKSYSVDGRSSEHGGGKQPTRTPSTPTPVSTTAREEEGIRSSKRKNAASRLAQSNPAPASMRVPGTSTGRKKMRVYPTEMIAEYAKLWDRPYVPPVDGVKMGQEVARDLSSKAEQAFVKATIALSTKEEADKVREEYVAKYKHDPIGAPTVYPPRPEDAAYLPGAELAGYMPRRGDLDIEWDNTAENSIADMEFSRTDTPQERQLKLQVLDIYCRKLDEREKRKNFILTRHLYDYRKYIEDDQKLPADERDLIHRMRLFERFHTPEEHRKFIEDLLKAKRLRKEIAKLQMYRRIGIRTLAEAEKFELDKQSRQFHKMALAQREQEVKAKNAKQSASGSSWPSAASAAAATGVSANLIANQIAPAESLWKQYRSNDRKFRRNSSRSTVCDEDQVGISTSSEKKPPPANSTNSGLASNEGELKPATIIPPVDSSIAMDVDDEGKPVATSPRKDNEDAGGEATGNGTSDQQKKNAASYEKPSSDDQVCSNIDDNKTGISPQKAPAGHSDSNTMVIDICDSQDKSKDRESASDYIKKAEGTPKEEETEEDYFDASKARGQELLSQNEIALCNRLKIYPMQYLPIKKALIIESFNKGLLDRSSSSRKTIWKIDITKRGPVIDFLVRAGWVDSKLRNAALSVDVDFDESEG